MLLPLQEGEDARSARSSQSLEASGALFTPRPVVERVPRFGLSGSSGRPLLGRSCAFFEYADCRNEIARSILDGLHEGRCACLMSLECRQRRKSLMPQLNASIHSPSYIVGVEYSLRFHRGICGCCPRAVGRQPDRPAANRDGGTSPHRHAPHVTPLLLSSINSEEPFNGWTKPCCHEEEHHREACTNCRGLCLRRHSIFAVRSSPSPKL
jgi:hypothetical protein